MLRTALAICLALLFALPASAQWTREQRSEFTTDCVEGCQTNPNVHPSRRSECGAYCGCVMGESEKFITAIEYDRIDKIARDGGKDPMLDRFAQTFPLCNKRIFGQ